MKARRVLPLFIISALLISFSFIVTGGEQADRENIPAKITICPPEGAEKGAVEFPHRKHSDSKDKGGLGYGCKKCHHKMKSSDETPTKCTGCHKLKPAEGDETPRLKDAFHDSCKDCHKKGDGKETDAPKKCNECHAKE
ncbi:MAG: cytochrome c3 family protein [Planctomycetota bacterium]|jgi:hypothetical protein